jgi:O-6-methylguanine DNA methyltransferase
MNQIYINYISSKTLDSIYLASIDKKHIIYVSIGKTAKLTLNNWITKHYPSLKTIYDKTLFPDYFTRIKQYLNKQIKELEIPFKLINITAFQHQVLTEIKKLQYGKTTTYGELADNINNSKASRAIGTACGNNPLPLIFPCHRVIGKNSLGGFSPGISYKKKLLKIEK